MGQPRNRIASIYTPFFSPLLCVCFGSLKRIRYGVDNPDSVHVDILITFISLALSLLTPVRSSHASESDFTPSFRIFPFLCSISFASSRKVLHVSVESNPTYQSLNSLSWTIRGRHVRRESTHPASH